MIRRAAIVAPIALLTSACLDRAYSPADYASDATVPPPAPIYVPPRAEVAAQWQLPAESPWSAYEKMTLLAALDETSHQWDLPDVEAIDEVHAARMAAYVIARAGLPPDTAWFVDLRGAASIAFARQIGLTSAARPAIVPTFNNWPAADEMVPAEETLAALVRLPPARAIDPGARPMFLLDSWRLAFKDAEVDEETTDNRYALSAGDVPSGAALRAQGIRRVIYVVPRRGEDAHEEDDLNEAFRDYQAAGIEIAIVGLDDLAAIERVDEWDARWPRWRVAIVERPLVVGSPAFHLRARSGWGGVHAVVGGGWQYGHAGG